MEMYAIVILSSLLQPSSLNPFEDPREMIKMIATKEYHLVTNYKDNWYVIHIGLISFTTFRINLQILLKKCICVKGIKN